MDGWVTFGTKNGDISFTLDEAKELAQRVRNVPMDTSAVHSAANEIEAEVLANRVGSVLAIDGTEEFVIYRALDAWLEQVGEEAVPENVYRLWHALRPE